MKDVQTYLAAIINFDGTPILANRSNPQSRRYYKKINYIEAQQQEIVDHTRCLDSFRRIKELMELQTQHSKLYDDVHAIARAAINRIEGEKP